MENNNNGIKMLKVSSILLIIGGAIATIMGIVGLLGVGALHAIFGSDIPIGLLYAVAGFAIASGVLTLIAGIVGVGACKKTGKIRYLHHIRRDCCHPHGYRPDPEYEGRKSV